MFIFCAYSCRLRNLTLANESSAEIPKVEAGHPAPEHPLDQREKPFSSSTPSGTLSPKRVSGGRSRRGGRGGRSGFKRNIPGKEPDGTRGDLGGRVESQGFGGELIVTELLLTTNPPSKQKALADARSRNNSGSNSRSRSLSFPMQTDHDMGVTL